MFNLPIDFHGGRIDKAAKAPVHLFNSHTVEQGSTPTIPRAKRAKIWLDRFLAWISGRKPISEYNITTVNTAALNQPVKTQAAKPKLLNNLIQENMNSDKALEDIKKLSRENIDILEYERKVFTDDENIAILNAQGSNLTKTSKGVSGPHDKLYTSDELKTQANELRSKERNDFIIDLLKNLSDPERQQLRTNAKKLEDEAKPKLLEDIGKTDDISKKLELNTALRLISVLQYALQ